jgi:hypothetical protein
MERESMDNTKIGKERGNCYCKNKEICRCKTHMKALTDIF